MTLEKNKLSASIARTFPFSFILVLVVAACFVDFPPGDSWTQGWTIKRWLDGTFELNDWATAPALPQQTLGWLISLNLKEIEWRRLSILTAVVTGVGILILAWFPSKLFPNSHRLKSWTPLFAVTAIAAPFTLKIALGFMTDGYYLFFMMTALWFLLSALDSEHEKGKVSWFRRWIGFVAFATLASLQRTHGILLIVIVPAWLLLSRATKKTKNGKRLTWHEWFVAALCLAGVALSLVIVSVPGFHPTRSSEVAREVIHAWLFGPKQFISMLLDRLNLLLGIIHHLGLVLFPVALIARLEKTASEKREKKSETNLVYVVGGTIFLLATFALFVKGQVFPYLGNSITDEGFGPRRDTILLTSGHLMNPPVRNALTLLSTLGGMVLIWLFSRSLGLRSINWRAPSTLIGLIGIGHFILIFANPNFFDRYLLPLLPFIICWIATFLHEAPDKSRLIGWTLALSLLTWSGFGTTDYLAWTKSKWSLAEELRARGIPPNEVIAGYEPDGYFNFSNIAYNSPPAHRYPPGTPWWVEKMHLPISPKYIIVEKGASVSGTPWENYLPSGLSNNRMEVRRSPDASPF